jgi:hypothetical protein
MVRHIFIASGTVDVSKISNHRILLLYANAMNEPMWGIDFASYMDFKMKPYDRSKGGLFEENSSISLWTQFPFNFGESFSSNHTFSTRIKLTDRNAKVIKDMDVNSDEKVYLDSSEFRFMRPPMSGKEGLIRLAYTWLNRRPHNLNYFFPKQGFGMMINLDYSNSNWYGDFDYTKIIWDGFINILPHKKSPIVIFTRVKSVSISGTNPPSQDMPAITNDTPLYLGGKNFLGADEVVHLRGWDDWRFGNRMIFGTVEPRIKLGKIVFTGFTDFGNVWYSDAKMDDWLVTAGYELRLDLFGLILAYGTAQEIQKWKDDDIPQNYVRLSLVNPF